MKQDLKFFYTDQSVVKISDRIYQPIDVRVILKRSPQSVETPKTAPSKVQIGWLAWSKYFIGNVKEYYRSFK